MSVIVKGMEMPANCRSCDFSDYEGRFCKVANVFIPMIGKSWFCPLVELPKKHGRLIDADALLKQKGDCYDHDGHLLYAVGTGNILYAPTIVEAEGDDS